MASATVGRRFKWIGRFLGEIGFSRNRHYILRFGLCPNRVRFALTSATPDFRGNDRRGNEIWNTLNSDYETGLRPLTNYPLNCVVSQNGACQGKKRKIKSVMLSIKYLL